ncbi:26S proteasome non-ATPase regulatory subunit 12 [Nymphon striatum]|nr:26S proteasome non-ATPase regulatory subunit 12 [Nymphon striatum]
MSDAISEGKIVKMEVDYTSSCDEKIPECEKLAKDGKLKEALEILFSLEKQTRTGADAHSTSRVLIKIVKLCFEAKNWNALIENVILLTKRRSQIKMAVTKMIQECYTYVDETPDEETKLKYIDTLRTVTAGKIYVEIERARLTHKLAKIKEAKGEITEAATVLHELQVETFGSMDKKEKVELILEQMRLCLATKDYIRTQIISKKISLKIFEDESTEELKLRYYNLMINLDQHEQSYLSIGKHYRAIYNTPCIQKDDDKRKEALKSVVTYVILASYDNEQSDSIHRIKEEKGLEEISKYKNLLTLFVTSELISWHAFCEIYEKYLKCANDENKGPDIFNPETEEGKKRWLDLKNRVVEHNIRVLAKYYTRITLQRMSELLSLTIQETEEFLSNLVVNKTVRAKTDRLIGVIDFTQHKDPNDVLNDWSHNVNALMQLVNKTTHLINKEEMVHKHLHT